MGLRMTARIFHLTPDPVSPPFFFIFISYSAYKGRYSQSYGFSSSHVRMWELDHKKDGVLKNWCFWTMVLEKTLKGPLDSKEIKPVNPKGNQSWIFTGRTDTEAEALILWSSDMKSLLIGKILMLGKIGGRRKRGLQRMRWLDCITDLMDMSLNKLSPKRQWRTGITYVESKKIQTSE